MTHTGPMHESEGEFTLREVDQRYCSTCKKITGHAAERWESKDGAYVDWKYTCLTCSLVHWVDGIDS